MRSWWARARCILITARLRSTEKAALQRIRSRQITSAPKRSIIEMRMFSMPDEEWEDTMVFTRGVTDNLKYSKNRVDAINALVSDRSERYTYYFDIFKYHSNWKTLFLPDQLECCRYEKKNLLKGLEIKKGVGPDDWTD